MLTDWEIRRNIIAFGKKAYEKGLVAASDGNISVRLFDDRLMITPSGATLGNLNPDNLIYLDLNGTILQGKKPPSSELPMHLLIYQQRPDVHAVFHTHPQVTTAFSVAGESLSVPVLPEMVIMFDTIPIAPYASPSSIESAEAIEPYIQNHDLIILDHHGVVALGQSLNDAFLKLEKLEHTAKTLLAAKQLGGINPLSPESVAKLKKKH